MSIITDFNENRDFFKNNIPLYEYALNNDKILASEIKIQFLKENNEDIKLIENYYGIKILPKLKEEYNKVFYIKTKDFDYKFFKKIRF